MKVTKSRAPAKKPASRKIKPRVKSTTSIYQMKAGRVPFGEYGRVLWHGIGKRDGGILHLERTGPFVPPVSQPAGFVVTDAVRQSLEMSGLKGMAFHEVHKAKIVILDWAGWDRSARTPRELPPEGKPENYVAMRPHDPELASSIGLLHELTSTGGGRKRGGSPRSAAEIAVHFAIGKGVDICVDGPDGTTYVSERAKQWFENRFGDILQFQAI